MRDKFNWEIGRVYRSKTGELLQLLRMTETSGEFQMLDSKTKEPSAYILSGPLEDLTKMAEEMGLQPVTEFKEEKPTGLILTPSDPRWINEK